MKKFVSFGEMLLVLMPPNYLRFRQTSSFNVFYGGSEIGAAASLANFGIDTSFVTKVPDSSIGLSGIDSLKSYGINTDNIVIGDGRLGIVFMEMGASIRPSRVIFDRENSTISNADISEFDFDNIFSECDFFHVSGITPALSEKSAALTKEILKRAKKYNVMVSMDLNYREALWTPEEAQRVIRPLMQYVDVCIGNEEDTEKCLGFKPEGSDFTKGDLNIEGYKKEFTKMKEEFGFKYIASSLRESYSASENGWSAISYDGKDFYYSRKYNIHLVDRNGGGDSFAAGFIYGLMNDMDLEEITEFAVAASGLKQTIVGPINMASIEEVKEVVRGNVSGRIQR